MKKWIITVVAVVVAAVLIIVFLPKRGKVAEKAAPLVEVTKVSRGTIARTLDIVGYVVPTRQTAAFARSYGKVKSIYVEEGSRVGKDQVLMILEPDEVGLDFEPQPIKAPIGGVVAKIMVKEGEPAAQGTPLVAIVDPYNLDVEISLAGDDYASVAEGGKAFLYLDSDTLPARIRSKSPVIDPMTRTFKITLAPQKTSPELLPGRQVNSRLILAEHSNVLTIPLTAVMDSTVTVITGDSVVPRTVELGISSQDKVEIIRGVSEGEWVVIFTGQKLRPGEKVRTSQR